MLTGPLAMHYYSQPRMTRDIDFVIEVHEKNIDTIVSAFEPDYYVERNAVSRAIALQRSFNIIDNEAFLKVDCLIRKDSEYHQLDFAIRREVTIQGLVVCIVITEDLIFSKLYRARESHSELQL